MRPAVVALPGAPCPNCRKQLNHKIELADPMERPQPGDFTCCPYCGEFLRFTTGFALVKAEENKAEWHEVLNRPELKQRLRQALEQTSRWRDQQKLLG